MRYELGFHVTSDHTPGSCSAFALPIAKLFERNRSNPVFMGILSLSFIGGQTAAGLGLDGTETFDINPPSPLEQRCTVSGTAKEADGKVITFDTLWRVDTRVEGRVLPDRGEPADGDPEEAQ